MKRTNATIGALGLAVAVAVAAWLAWTPLSPNVVWISIDSLRADRLPAYGFAAGRTPYLDYLANNGVVFERAFADAPWTTASMASSMTGRFAVHHGLRTRLAPLSSSEITVAEILSAHGWQTGAIVGSFELDRVYGLDRGFARYDDRYDSAVELAGERPHLASALHANVDEQRNYLNRKRRHDSYRSDAAVGDAAVAWLKTATRRDPVFLWVHFFGPHRRVQRGDDLEQMVRRTIAPYEDHVAEVDAQIGRIVDGLAATGRWDNTIFVVQADHGMGLGDHGELDHGRTLYDSVLRVPLIIAWPGYLSPARVAEMVRTIDIAPTVLGLLGIAKPAAMDGTDLLPGREPRPTPAVLVAETLLGAEVQLSDFQRSGMLRSSAVRVRAVRTPRWKYVLSEPHPVVNYSVPPPLEPGAPAVTLEQLFDLERDPGETANVAANHPNLARELRELLAAQEPKRR